MPISECFVTCHKYLITLNFSSYLYGATDCKAISAMKILTIDVCQSNSLQTEYLFPFNVGICTDVMNGVHGSLFRHVQILFLDSGFHGLCETLVALNIPICTANVVISHNIFHLRTECTARPRFSLAACTTCLGIWLWEGMVAYARAALN